MIWGHIMMGFIGGFLDLETSNNGVELAAVELAAKF